MFPCPPSPCARAFCTLGSLRLQIIIPRAGHACYLDQPEAFHMHLLAFVRDCLNSFKRP